MRKSWHTNNTSARTHPETRAQIKNPYIPLAYLSLEHSCQRSLNSSQRDPPLQTRRRDAIGQHKTEFALLGLIKSTILAIIMNVQYSHL